MTDTDISFNEIFERHYERVFNLCLRMCGNRHTAQDLTQDVFLKIYRNLDKYRGQSKISTWIWSVSVNHCLDFLKREKGLLSRVTRFFQLKEEPSERLEEHVVNREAGMRILKGLSPRNRALFILKIYMQFSYEEIARILDMTPQSVGVQLSRARKAAGKIAEKEGITL